MDATIAAGALTPVQERFASTSPDNSNVVHAADNVAEAPPPTLEELERDYRALQHLRMQGALDAIDRIIRARSLGERMARLPTAQGRRDPNGPPTKQEALERLGVSRQRASEWELLARVDEALLRTMLTARGAVGDEEITMRSALAIARGQLSEQHGPSPLPPGPQPLSQHLEHLKSTCGKLSKRVHDLERALDTDLEEKEGADDAVARRVHASLMSMQKLIGDALKTLADSPRAATRRKKNPASAATSAARRRPTTTTATKPSTGAAVVTAAARALEARYPGVHVRRSIRVVGNGRLRSGTKRRTAACAVARIDGYAGCPPLTGKPSKPTLWTVDGIEQLGRLVAKTLGKSSAGRR